ncbi:MAG: 23S rRNA (uracil(1939)-C(5))-methyltransferase RlmD [Chlamydiales bacterium]|nr:23S rRNA (uracil(1939)-C(5))-methyltransferase RlmD [Chlamydiales bacterium]
MKTTIRSLGSSGEGVGTDETGKTLFIEGALPGETVEYTLDVEKKRYAKGKLVCVVESSPHRTKPPCPLFGTCGGCHIQHLTYEQQLAVKRQRVIDALQRIGHLDHDVEPCIPSPQPLHYRNKIQLPHKSGEIGLFRKNSHDIVPLTHCYIHCELGEKIYSWIREKVPPTVEYLLIRTGIFTEEALLIFVGSGDLQMLAKEAMHTFCQIKGVVLNTDRKEGNRILGNRFKTVCGRPHIFEQIGNLKFKISAPSFFQVNSWQAKHLFEEAASHIEGDFVIDAFCGVGTLALFAAQKCKKVLGIEVIAEAIHNARENASLNNSTNCTFEVGRAEKRTLECDTLLLNPPRKGCDSHLIRNVSAKKVVYISCDPATLARDLAALKKYRIEKVQPFDMFPQTMHVETIAVLSLA